ncbi:MAG: helix-turn-helix domain-containing protein [Selenomonas sp.]|nr:helix-turn-helix domain-containing protein [Selenomonas sp.]
MSMLTFKEPANPVFAQEPGLQLSYLCSLSSGALPLPADCCGQAEMLFIMKGSGTCTIHNTSHQVGRGDVVLINKGCLRSFSPQHGASSTLASSLGLKNLQMANLPEGHFLPEGTFPIIKAGSAYPLMTQLLQQMKKISHGLPSPLHQEACNHLAQALLLLILEQSSHCNLEGTGGNQDSAYTLGQHIKAYLDSHYLEELSLPQIAAGLRISPYYMSHIFKECTGCSPMQYITQLRIAEAQNLLLSTQMSVTDIAMQCGYNNSNYFQSVFSKLVGMPPGKYRSAWK